MSHFIENEEQLSNDQENVKYLDSTSVNSNAKKSRKKALFGAPSWDTLFTLSHDLIDFSVSMSYLVNRKGFYHVLIGRGNNDPLKHRFSAKTHLE